jgi:hypothetical protein
MAGEGVFGCVPPDRGQWGICVCPWCPQGKIRDQELSKRYFVQEKMPPSDYLRLLTLLVRDSASTNRYESQLVSLAVTIAVLLSDNLSLSVLLSDWGGCRSKSTSDPSDPQLTGSSGLSAPKLPEPRQGRFPNNRGSVHASTKLRWAVQRNWRN